MTIFYKIIENLGNLVKTIKKHKLLLFLFVLFCAASLIRQLYPYPPKLKIFVQDDNYSEWVSIIRPLNEEEIQQCYDSLRLIKLIDSSQCDELFKVDYIYWIDSPAYHGLSVNMRDNKKAILLDISLKISGEFNSWDYFKLGMALCHELHHIIFNSKDPYTESVTDAKLLNLITTNKMNFHIVDYWKL